MLLTYYSHQTEKNREKCFNTKTNAGKQLLFLSLIRIFIQQIVRRKPVKTIAFIESHFVYWKPLLLVEAIFCSKTHFFQWKTRSLIASYVRIRESQYLSFLSACQHLIRSLAYLLFISDPLVSILSSCYYLICQLAHPLVIMLFFCYYLIILVESFSPVRYLPVCQYLLVIIVTFIQYLLHSLVLANSILFYLFSSIGSLVSCRLVIILSTPQHLTRSC